MTAAVLAPSLVGALGRWFPQRELAWCGAALLVLVPVGLAWARLDLRTVNGEAVGLKPTRFALSIGVYMLTASWMIGYVHLERLTSLPVRATVSMMIVGCAVELLLITLQAARARQSHFNISTPTDAGIYATMGLFAVLFIGAVLPLAWEIARRPRPGVDPVMIWAIVAGLLLTFLIGGGTGGYMSRSFTHAVGPEGWRLPFFGWSFRSGDIRIPHFFGIHAMQALPLIAAAAQLARGRAGALLFAAGALGYAALTLGLLHQALRGQPPVPALEAAA